MTADEPAPPSPGDRGAPPLLELRDVGKKFCREPRRALRYTLADLARNAVGRTRSPDLRPGEFWAVEGVSFTLARGEAVGILGANGAGKSTLLRVVQGRVAPERGQVRVDGRLSTISDLGLGFDPRLSGRENALHAATLLGLGVGRGRDGRADEEALLAAIADFSGLGDVLDTPVGTYSSGMRARLGFAVAAQLEPDLLLVDEALAVGDFAFRRKCIRHLASAAERGRALLLVSHDLYTLQVLCRRALLLERGRVAFDGPVAEAVALYLESQRERRPAPESHAAGDDAAPVRIDDVVLEGEDGGPAVTGRPAIVRVRCHAAHALPDVPWFFQIATADLMIDLAAGVGALEGDGAALPAGEGELAARIARLPLLAGAYALRAALVEPGRRAVLALFGFRDAPAYANVEAPPNEVARLVRLSRSLVELDCTPLPGGRYHQ